MVIRAWLPRATAVAVKVGEHVVPMERDAHGIHAAFLSDRHVPLRYRVLTPWDFRDRYSFRAFDAWPNVVGQPLVTWRAVVLDRERGEERSIDGHVEIRWSHGRFSGAPEAKVHLDSSPHAVAGYEPLTTCTNASGQTSCANTTNDNNNCGACGNVCGPGTTCQNGTCACPVGQTLCNGRCVSTQTDNSNCGTCGNLCGAGATCQSGVCQCAPGTTRCGNTCVNTQTDTNNCGACARVCPAGANTRIWSRFCAVSNNQQPGAAHAWSAASLPTGVASALFTVTSTGAASAPVCARASMSSVNTWYSLPPVIAALVPFAVAVVPSCSCAIAVLVPGVNTKRSSLPSAGSAYDVTPGAVAGSSVSA